MKKGHDSSLQRLRWSREHRERTRTVNAYVFLYKYPMFCTFSRFNIRIISVLCISVIVWYKSVTKESTNCYASIKEKTKQPKVEFTILSLPHEYRLSKDTNVLSIRNFTVCIHYRSYWNLDFKRKFIFQIFNRLC